MAITETNNRILIIDDNPSIHDDFRKILIKNGFSNLFWGVRIQKRDDVAVSNTCFRRGTAARVVVVNKNDTKIQKIPDEVALSLFHSFTLTIISYSISTARWYVLWLKQW